MAWAVRLWRQFDCWWFAPTQRHQLGVFRILLLGWFAWFYSQRLFARLEEVVQRPAEFYDPPTLAVWAALPPPPSWLGSLEPWLLLLIGLALVGVLTRFSLVVLALCNLALGLWVNAWGYTAHASALPALALCVLALAPGATQLSLEGFLRRRWAGTAAICRTRAHSIWPVRMLLVLLCCLYFAAGVSKLRASGLRWADGATLGFYLGGGSPRAMGEVQRFIIDDSASAEQRFRDGIGVADHAYVGSPTPLGLWLSRQPGWLALVSHLSLAWELLFPLALLGPRPLALALLGGLMFHLGIALTLRINFASYLVCYAVFVDWRAMLSRWTSRPPDPLSR